MEVKRNVNKVFGSVTYRLGDVVVDPGDSLIFDDVRAVLLTHAHFDHIYGLNELLKRSPDARVFTNSSGARLLLNARKNLSFYHGSPFVIDRPENIVTIDDDTSLEAWGLGHIRAYQTPGHHPSCITWAAGSHLFSGDAYIPGIKTPTNLPGGNRALAEDSLSLILELACGRILHPGHDLTAAYEGLK